VGQTVPLLGRREQALGQERERLGEDGQLARPGVTEPAVDTDQIAEVEELSELPAQLADLLLADEDLDAAGPVAEFEEDDFALTAAEHDPAGDADHRTGLVATGHVGRGRRTDFPDRLVAIESLTPRIQPQVRDPPELLQAYRF